MFTINSLLHRISNFGRRLTGRRQAPKKARGAQLNLESLESRWVPASVGMKTAILDFTGESVTTAQMNDGGWNRTGVTATSFQSLFTSARPHLDMNGDRIVNSTDATLAIDAIVARVQADYAPYNISIVSGELQSNASRLSDSMVGDAFMVISGGTNNVASQFSTGIYGVAPVDAGNVNDDIGFVFGKNIVDFYSTREGVINGMARTISHEMGHTFGLEHTTDTAGDTVSHHLMNAPNGPVDPRDFTRDFVFVDHTFNTDVGPQNAHQILSRSNVLGESPNAWMAVLTPGTLTIKGSESSDTINVTQNTLGTSWTVTGAGRTQTMTLASVNTTSFNPFDAPLNRIYVSARGGHDFVAIDTDILATTEIYGGAGIDTIYGGGGQDYIYGNGDTDYLYGRGGNDYLMGGGGSDFLYGGQGDDFLIGGDVYYWYDIQDNARDTLDGGADADTIINYWDDFRRPEDSMVTDSLDNIVWKSLT
jgi:hypothetical protein